MIIIHASDIHIGATFGYLGRKAEAKRAQLKDTFRAIIDLALAKKAAILLISGDLFDRNEVASQDVHFVREQLLRLRETNTHTFLIGGTHDFFSDFPILQSDQFTQGLPHHLIHVIKTPEPILVENLNVAISGASNNTKKSLESPLKNLKPDPQAKLNIAMLHGSLQIPGKSAENDFPFTKEEIDASGFDYIACGHWHSMQDLSTPHTRAWYAGSAEPFEFNQTKSGHVLQLQINDTTGKIEAIEPIKVSKTEFIQETIDVTHKDYIAVKKQIIDIANENCAPTDAPKYLYAQIKLRGTLAPGTIISRETLEQELEQQFAYLAIDDSGIATELTAEELEQYPETLVIGAFIRNMQKEITAEQDPNKRLMKERALQKGVALLEGKDVV